MAARDDAATLEAACATLGFRVRRDEDGRAWIDDGSRGFTLPPGGWPLNTPAARAVARDKRACGARLREAGFATPTEIAVDMSSFPESAWQRLQAAVAAIGYPVFVKPSDGSMGQLAARVVDAAGVRRQLGLIAQRHAAALVQAWIDLPEYRLFHCDGALVFGYRRTPPDVVGDGRRSLREQVDALCAASPAFEPGYGLDRDWILDQLRAHRLDWTRPLPDGLRIRLGARANGIAGGRFSDLRVAGEGLQPFPPRCEDWLRRLAHTLGLRVFAVDLFSASCLASPEDACVIDVNAQPRLDALLGFGREDLRREVWCRVLRTAMAEAPTIDASTTDRPAPVAP